MRNLKAVKGFKLMLNLPRPDRLEWLYILACIGFVACALLAVTFWGYVGGYGFALASVLFALGAYNALVQRVP